MLRQAGYPGIAGKVDVELISAALSEVESSAREKYTTERNTVKHNRGTDIFEAGNIRFGLEMRRLASGDGGLAIHVLADLAGPPVVYLRRKPNYLPSIASGKPPTTITVPETKIIGFTGIGR